MRRMRRAAVPRLQSKAGLPVMGAEPGGDRALNLRATQGGDEPLAKRASAHEAHLGSSIAPGRTVANLGARGRGRPSFPEDPSELEHP